MGTLYVYFKDGRVFSYEVADSKKAREHMAKIRESGYRHFEESTQCLEWYLPHYIDKMKYELGSSEVSKDVTNYPSKVKGT